MIGLILLFLYWYPLRGRIAHGLNDFLSLYTGAELTGTSGQFDPARYRELEIASTGYFSDAWVSNRLPAFMLVLRPLTRLSYQTAYSLWQALSFAALIGFLLLWRTRERGLLVLVCCWSFPLTAAFANGQDDTFLLLWFALALYIAPKRPALAGAILALGAMKFHLFILVPVALMAGRRSRMLAGFSASAAAAFGLCFVAAGRHWIGPWLQLVFNPAVNPNPGMMPNLHGLLAGLPHADAWEAIASLLVLAAVWRLASYSNLPAGLAVALAGGILVSRHAYNADLALLIPALWILCREFPTRPVRLLSAALLTPVWFLLPIPGLNLPPAPLLLIALFAALTASQAQISRSWASARELDIAAV